MLINLGELKSYPFVNSCLDGKITSAKVELLTEDLNAFIVADPAFRDRFGFENKEYSIREAISIIRQILGQRTNKKIIEFDEGTFAGLNGHSHQFDAEIEQALRKIGTIIRENQFSGIVPLTILVKKEKLDSWDATNQVILNRINAYFNNLNAEDALNFSSGIYTVKTNRPTLGHLIRDDRNASIPALVSVPNKGTINHETIHFIQRLFYYVPSGESGGIASFFDHPEYYSLFMVEFLGYLIEYGDITEYKGILHHPTKFYRFKYPENIDVVYDRKIEEFAKQLKNFIFENKDGLLSYIVFYPFYRSGLGTSHWTNFDVPDNPVEDIMAFKSYLNRYGYDLDGIPVNSGLANFMRKQFEEYAREWFMIYQSII